MKILLKSLRRIHVTVNPEASAFGRNWKILPNKEYSSKLIHDALLMPGPLMVARLGATELACMVNYLGVQQTSTFKMAKRYVTNQSPPWWWNQATINQMRNWSGFFPSSVESIERFCEMMIADLPAADIIGSWLKEESFFAKELQGAKKVMLEDLEPFFATKPWTSALSGKKVLVVHPFASTIESQYAHRQLLFDDGLLPDFDLTVIEAVQSIAGQKTKFADWFEALDHMKSRIADAEFDVCILGCGAYGFPLAAFVKGLGKKAIHLGGATQLLFGIKGARWEHYVVYPYANLFNDAWVRPAVGETPKDASTVEGACYW